MNIPPFWIKEHYEQTDQEGRVNSFAAYGWSFDSLEDARLRAVQRAKRIYNYVINETSLDEYEYSDGPIREEIVDAVKVEDEPVAIVTRNRYGALVLNTTNVLFVDIDFPPIQGDGFLDSIKLIFNPKRRAAKQETLKQQTIANVEHWWQQNPNRSFRLYQTPEGLRLLFTDQLYDPTTKEIFQLFNQLEADPLYVRLTQKQKCFRARLTPKPWRCDFEKPPNTFPWDDAQAEERYRDWQHQYLKVTANFRACKLHQTYGDPADIDTIHTLVRYHDQQSKIAANAPMA